MRTFLLAAMAVLILAGVSMWATSPGTRVTVHEWGTFTSVQGADGVQMDWNPLVAPDLPSFVYDRFNPTRRPGPRNFFISGKTAMSSIQRMETPVIYFYSDRPRTVDVAVRFPEGMITEWYPLQNAADLAVRPASQQKPPALHWPKVSIVPADASAPLPTEKAPSHYYAARETDAALVRTEASGKTEAEKFLFYRGVAGFQAPLTVKLESADAARVTLQNTGPEPLAHLFVYQVREKGGTWLSVEKLAPGEKRSVLVPEPGEGAAWDGLAPALRQALAEEGLFAKEAAAMVKTWESSWFAEPGLRVLYTLPRAWTDRTLPLTVQPAPAATERVMVARAEVIAPASERALRALVEKYMAAPVAERPAIVAETRALGLGRFMEPAMRRVMRGETRPEFYAGSWELMNAAAGS